MATMKCKSCNRIYNYRSSELCPKCGAYNRPPHRMQVAFDENGNAVLNADKSSSRAAYAATEKKATYTESARKVRDTLVENDIIDSKTLDTLGEQLNKWGGRLEKWWVENSEKSRHAANDSPLRDRKKGKSGGAKAVAVIAALSIFISLLGTIMESCESNLVHIAPEPDYSIATEEVAPYDRYWSAEDRKMILDAYAVSEEVGMGTVFEWQDVKMWLGGWELSGGSGDNFMVVSVNCGDVFPEERLDDCFLLWVDWDGTEWVYTPTKFQNGALIFDYLHADTIPEDALCWVLFNDYDENNNWIGTTAVSLVEHATYLNSALDASEDFTATENVTAIMPYLTEDEQKELLSSYGVTAEVNLGTTFDWQDSAVRVSGWRMNGEGDRRLMTVSLESYGELPKEVLLRCYLVWAEGNNRSSWTYYPESYQNGELTFSGFESAIHEDATVWLLCENYEENAETGEIVYVGTTAVSLH